MKAERLLYLDIELWQNNKKNVSSIVWHSKKALFLECVGGQLHG